MLLSELTKSVRKLFNNHAPVARPRKARLGLEALEDRQLLNGGPTFSVLPGWTITPQYQQAIQSNLPQLKQLQAQNSRPALTGQTPTAAQGVWDWIQSNVPGAATPVPQNVLGNINNRPIHEVAPESVGLPSNYPLQPSTPGSYTQSVTNCRDGVYVLYDRLMNQPIALQGSDGSNANARHISSDPAAPLDRATLPYQGVQTANGLPYIIDAGGDHLVVVDPRTNTAYEAFQSSGYGPVIQGTPISRATFEKQKPQGFEGPYHPTSPTPHSYVETLDNFLLYHKGIQARVRGTPAVLAMRGKLATPKVTPTPKSTPKVTLKVTPKPTPKVTPTPKATTTPTPKVTPTPLPGATPGANDVGHSNNEVANAAAGTYDGGPAIAGTTHPQSEVASTADALMWA